MTRGEGHAGQGFNSAKITDINFSEIMVLSCLVATISFLTIKRSWKNMKQNNFLCYFAMLKISSQSLKTCSCEMNWAVHHRAGCVDDLRVRFVCFCGCDQ
jgi:hypothetical protein